MPPIASRDFVVKMSFGISHDQRKRLKHHAKRINMDMTDIMRIGLSTELDLLDEKERLSKHRKPHLASVPETYRHSSGPIKGLGLKNRFAVPVFKFAPFIPPELKKSENQTENFTDQVRKKLFPKYAEYLETAEDKIDSELRAQKVIDDIRERASSKTESISAYDALMDFMKLRSESRRNTVDASKAVVIAGDVDEE